MAAQLAAAEAARTAATQTHAEEKKALEERQETLDRRARGSNLMVYGAPLDSSPATTSSTLQEVLDMVGRHISLCEKELGKLGASAPRIVTNQQRALDMLLLAATATWVFYARGLGLGAPVSLRLGGAKGLQLPLGYGGVEKAVAVLLLLAAIQQVVFVKVH